MRGRAKYRIDPRAGLLLLVMANVIAFSQDDPILQIAWIFSLFVLCICCGAAKAGLKWLVLYTAIYGLAWYLTASAPQFLVVSFVLYVNFARRVFGCFMLGGLLIQSISMREFVAAMRRLRIPESIVIPLAVTVRYFPAIREERRHIKDALALRNIHGFERIEAFVVPFMMSATNTADELSEAAVTRGIENPARKTGTIRLKMNGIDAFWLLIGAAFSIWSILV